VRLIDAGMESVPGSALSLRHGCRCVPEPGVTVEDLLVVIGEQIGFDNILSASRMNKAIVVFLKSETLVNQVTVSGLWVKETLSAPATKINISNVPPFVSNDVIMKELQRFGKIASPVKMIPLGCKNAALKHVLSFRRQVYMFLTSPTRTLEVSFRVNHGENMFMIYASTESLKCFECGDLGHKRLACPHRDEQRPSTSREDTGVTVEHHNNAVEQRSVEQGGVTKEAKEQEEVSVNAERVNDTEAIVQVGSKNTAVSDMIEMNDGSKGVVMEVVDDEGAQAGGSEENIVDEVEECSQSTDDGMREGEQCSDGEVGNDLYTVEEINAFLDETKGKSGVEIEDYFPDLEKFVSSVMKARTMSSYEAISQQKRFRLKKHLTVIRWNKNTGRGGITRGTAKLLL